MKKTLLVLGCLICMLLTVSFTVMAEPGFHIGLGYSQLNNEQSFDVLSTNIVDFHTSSQAYILDLGYDFSDFLAINAQYRWGTSDIFSILNDSLQVKSEVSSWQLEALAKWQIAKNTRLGVVLGYADSSEKGKLEVGSGFNGDLKLTNKGFYLGPVLTYKPTDAIELGLIYRWMINPDGDIKASISGLVSNYKIDIDDLSVSNLDLYVRAAINKNWAVKTGYTYSWVDYKINNLIPYSIDNSSHSSGLYAIFQYKF